MADFNADVYAAEIAPDQQSMLPAGYVRGKVRYVKSEYLATAAHASASTIIWCRAIPNAYVIPELCMLCGESGQNAGLTLTLGDTDYIGSVDGDDNRYIVATATGTTGAFALLGSAATNIAAAARVTPAKLTGFDSLGAVAKITSLTGAAAMTDAKYIQALIAFAVT